LDGYDPTNAGRRLQEFIDQLSNWYVRRSRRRFWKSENDQDKLSAYVTLHTCLVAVAKLMAPLAPFVSEEIYQDLVCAVDPEAPDSVHLANFPVADGSLIDEPLMEATRLAMRISSMGRGARSRGGLKVRQPLSQVIVRTRTDDELGYLELITPQVLEELNIKSLQPLAEDSGLYDRAREESGEKTEATLPVDNYWVVMEGGYMVAVDATITPELAEEGLARELVHRIQNMRRSANFDLTDRIVTYYQGPDELSNVMTRHAAYIQLETLTEEIVHGEPVEGAETETARIEGMEVVLGVRRV
jgi:isoleucyl-tRNA synthetase